MRYVRGFALMVAAVGSLPAVMVGQDQAVPTRIATATFSVEPPHGKGWTVTVAQDNLGVEFQREKKGFLSFKTPEATSIAVLTNETTAENAARGADSVAADFFDQEESRLRAETRNTLREEVALKRADRKVDSVGVYRLFIFEPTIQVSDWSGRIQQDQQLCLYFPPDFEARHQFFMFHIVKTHPPKTMWEKRSFGELRPLIVSFQDARPPADVSVGP